MIDRSFKIVIALLLMLNVFPEALHAQNDEDPDSGIQEELVILQDPQEEKKDDETKQDSDPEILPELSDPQEESEETVELIKEEENKTEEESESNRYTRTILMYAIGSDLESDSGLCSFNLEQILNSDITDNEDINFIIMTGGAEEWFLDSEYLYEVDKIDPVYNCIWKVIQADPADEHGRLLLLDGDGVLGDDENAKRAEPLYTDDEDPEMIGERSDYEWMNDPEVLKAFINYGVSNYPADEYDLILWDHGGGPNDGYGMDEHDIKYGNMMPLSGLIDALSNNDVIDNGGRFGILNFDACMMNSVELFLALYPYAEYYLASPESIPGYGEQYEGWLNMLDDDPAVNNRELGQKIVDDFYTYYEEGYEDGTSQPGTLALIDTDALVQSGFIDLLMQLNDLLYSQVKDVLYYDELSSAKNSIIYGNNAYYVDLGNLLAQLCVNSKEFDEEKLPIGGRDFEVNDYYSLCLELMNILEDEDIIYNRFTSDVYKDPDILYRVSDGEIKFAELRPLTSSGMYIFFSPLNNGDDVRKYDREIKDALKFMPEGEPKDFLSAYTRTMLYYGFMIVTGSTVSEMVDNDYDKNDFDYQTVKAYWKYDPYTEEYPGVDLSRWKLTVEEYIEQVLGHPFEDGEEPEEFVDWMNRLTKKCAEEAIDRDKISLYTVQKEAGTGYRINIDDTRKRVIDKVGYDLIAELPILEKFLDDEDIRWALLPSEKDEVELSVGSISGTQFRQIDEGTEEDYILDYVRWLNSDSAIWDLDPIEEKLYAISDGNETDTEGNARLHAAMTEDYYGYKLVPTRMLSDMPDEEGEPVYEMVCLFFEGEDLVQLMMIEDGAYRPVQVKDLKKTLVLTPCTIITVFLSKVYAPISEQLIVSADNADKIKLITTDVDNIPDIADTNGDGKKLTKRIVINNIYNYKTDITDLIESPVGDLTHIELAQVKDGEYTGEELEPQIVYKDKILQEGVDYKLLKWSDDDIFLEPGEYSFVLEGRGDFTGSSIKDFKIAIPETQYAMVDGQNSIWQKGSPTGISFRFKRNYNDELTYGLFSSIKVDGKPVESDEYEVRCGSVVIDLKPTFLEKLSVGDHTITAVFEEGIQSKPYRFTIRAKDADDSSSRIPYIVPVTGIEAIHTNCLRIR